VHQRLAIHWARLVELLYAAEHWWSWLPIRDHQPELPYHPNRHSTRASASFEAPRGTLTHHYWTDERGVVTKVNLVVAHQ